MHKIKQNIRVPSFNRRGGVCPPKYINRFISGRIRAGKPCPYRYIHPFSILNEKAVNNTHILQSVSRRKPICFQMPYFYGFRPKTVWFWFENRTFSERKPYVFGTENVRFWYEKHRMELCENTLFILLIKKLTMKKLVSLFVVVSCLFVEGISQTVRSFQREDNRVVLKMTDGELQLYPLSPNTLRVKFVKQSVGMEMPEWIYVNGGKEETFAIEEDA